jgi:hypothetical protein
MRALGDTTHGQRLRSLIVVMWRGGLWISEALVPTARWPSETSSEE